MRYGFIQAQRAFYPVILLCRVMQVSRSGFYAWQGRGSSVRDQANAWLLDQILRIHRQSREHYGLRKVWQALHSEGISVGKNRIARLRRQHEIYSKRQRRFVITTRSRHREGIALNHLNRQFNVARPNEVWVGDVTFIPTREGWLYLAVLLDLYARKVVGWAMSARNNGALVLDCLNMAIARRRPPSGLIHHSDRGVTYATPAYRQRLAERGMVPSMSGKRDCWDNAVAESFFGTLKNELVHDADFRSRDEARLVIFEYIEVFYHRQRLHQTLNYQTPQVFEAAAP